MACSLEANEFNIWSGCAYHMCWLGKAALQEKMHWGCVMPHLLPCFSCTCSTRYSTFQQVWLAAGRQNPSGDWIVSPLPGVKSNLPILAGCYIAISIDDNFPRCDGAWSSQQHSTLIHGDIWGNGWLSWLLYLCSIRCLGRGPIWHMGQ